MKTIKSLISKTSLVLFSILASLILGECIVRLYLYGGKGFSYEQLNSFKNLGQSGLLKRSENDSILWELQSNLDTLFKFHHFSTNKLGMRDRFYDNQKPINTKRIAVIGDSFAMGSGVANDENYASLIEEMLNKKYPDTNIEVLNFGVGGYGLRNYDAVLRAKAMLFEPDLVIIGFSDNDFDLPKQQEVSGKLKLREPVEMFYRSHLKILFKRLQENRTFPQAEPSNPIQIAYLEAHLNSISNQCVKKGIPGILAYSPVIYKEENTLFCQEKSKKSGLHFINASKGLENIPLKNIRVHLFDSHPNAKTHKVFANNIYNYITRENLLYLNN